MNRYQWEARQRIVIVGEAPGIRQMVGDVFTGPTGDRLDRLLGRPWRNVLLGVNLLDEHQDVAAGGCRFPPREGRAAASAFLRGCPWFGEGQRVILAGRRVAAAFGLADAPYFEWALLGPSSAPLRTHARVAVVPHPSGRCRW